MNLDKIVKDLSLKYNLDERVIRAVTNSPFLFVKDVMGALEDDTPIRLPYFGVFVERFGVSKMKKQADLLRTVVLALTILYNMSDDRSDDYKQGIEDSIQHIVDILKNKGYEDEQLVQLINDWQSRT